MSFIPGISGVGRVSQHVPCAPRLCPCTPSCQRPRLGKGQGRKGIWGGGYWEQLGANWGWVGGNWELMVGNSGQLGVTGS